MTTWSRPEPGTSAARASGSAACSRSKSSIATLLAPIMTGPAATANGRSTHALPDPGGATRPVPDTIGG